MQLLHRIILLSFKLLYPAVKIKNSILIILCILTGYVTRAAAFTSPEPVCLPDNTICYKGYDNLNTGQDENPGAISPATPRKQQLRFRSKFRLPGCLTAHLMAPQYIVPGVAVCAGKTIYPPGRYWNAPFYYIFLFRLTPF